MAEGGKTPIKKDFEMIGVDNPSISVPMSNASVAMNDFITKGTQEALFKGGYKECIEKMDKGMIKYGRILALVRSFEHHILREAGMENSILAALNQLFLKPTIHTRAKRKLAEMGQADRSFAYVHTAIYVGSFQGKHYVVENAGGQDKDEGPWLRLSDVKSAFDDLPFDKSQFLVIKPGKAHETAQRAMAAYYHQFRYRYNGFGFNCETFTSVCAGLFDHSPEKEDEKEADQQVEAIIDTVSCMIIDQQEQQQQQQEEEQEPQQQERIKRPKVTKPNPLQRKLDDKVDMTKVRKGAFDHANNERKYYVKELQRILLENLENIDRALYELKLDPANGEVCVNKKS